MPLRIDERCIGCGKCLRSCPFGALAMVDNVPEVGPQCTLCGACVDVCPVEAIHIDDVERGADLSGWRGVWVFGEPAPDGLHPVTFELLGKGRELADKLNQELALVTLGAEGGGGAFPEGTVHALRRADDARLRLGQSPNDHALRRADDARLRLGQFPDGAPVDRVIAIADDRLGDYNPATWTNALCDVIKIHQPSILLAGATALGRGLIPRLAARLDTGLTADCTALDIDPDERILLQTRPAFGGNIMATIVCRHTRPQIATVRPRVLPAIEPTGAPAPPVVRIDADESWFDPRQRVIRVVRESAGGGGGIESADAIVAGGKGLGGPQGFDDLRRFAERIGAAVGASRAAVDAGWIDYATQVGQTGKTVQPKLYVAVGISGSVQHRVGMQSAEAIVAINSDPHAPIFNVADYGIVGDWRAALPVLETLLQTADVS